MNWIEALFLGLIQGLTEFLPVSSSGHLELGKHLFGLDHEANFYFSIYVHGATVLSTIVVFRKDITDLVKGFFRFRMNDETRYVFKLIVSMIPALIAGLFIQRIVALFFTGNMILLGFEFMVTAGLLLLSTLVKPGEKPIRFIDSFIIGIAQVVAILPGISRSGTTIATGIMLGNNKSEIARFSFLMVLVPIIGANLLELHVKAGTISTEKTSFAVIMVGIVVAFLSGYLACRWMINLIKKGNLLWFAVYCLAAGIFSLLLGFKVF